MLAIKYLYVKLPTKQKLTTEIHGIPSMFGEMGHHALAGSYLSMKWGFGLWSKGENGGEG